MRVYFARNWKRDELESQYWLRDGDDCWPARLVPEGRTWRAVRIGVIVRPWSTVKDKVIKASGKIKQ